MAHIKPTDHTRDYVYDARYDVPDLELFIIRLVYNNGSITISELMWTLGTYDYYRFISLETVVQIISDCTKSKLLKYV